MKFTNSLMAVLAATQATDVTAQKHKPHKMKGEAKKLFDDSMKWLDIFWDEKIPQLHDTHSNAQLNHETRHSAWYAFGLLARNKGKDVRNAERAINFLIDSQYNDVDESEAYFGAYTREAEEPPIASEHYPAVEWSSWDPNWRSFIGTTFIMMYEEFGHLLKEETKQRIVSSVYNASVGDAHRGLNPAYSNPAVMYAIHANWAGHMMDDEAMIEEGESFGQEVIDLFDMHGTVAEFNGATYTAVTLYGLILWSKYGTDDSILSERGPDMVDRIWEYTSQIWHPGLRNLAGPWDRTYGIDMNTHFGVLSLLLAPITGRRGAGLPDHPEIMSHHEDYAWGPVMTYLSDYHNSLVDKKYLNSLKKFDKERTWEGQAYYPPNDLESRNITVWQDKKIQIGAESYRCRNSNGPANNRGQFKPAVVHWSHGDDEIGWFVYRSTEAHVVFDVEPNRLTIRYPEGNADSTFIFFVSPSLRQRNVLEWGDISGVDISISGNVNAEYDLQFGGRFGGSSDTYADHNLWRFEHKMPSGFSGVPEIVIDFEVE